MANKKKGFVMYFDSLGLLSLFPPEQIGELLLALYDYARRICETEESPEEALFRYDRLDETTRVGFISMAGHILRDTQVWKQRQANSRTSALQRVQRQQTAAKETPAAAEKPTGNPPVPARPAVPLREPNWNGMVTEREVVNYLEDREYARMAERFPVLRELEPEEQEASPEVRRAYVEKIRTILNGVSRPVDETPIEEVM